MAIDLRITLSSDNSPDLPAIQLQKHVLGSPQFPTVQARRFYEAVLDCFSQHINPHQKAAILGAFQVLLDAIDHASVDGINQALASFVRTMNNQGLDPFLTASVQGTGLTLGCMLLCPAQPLNPPPGQNLWALLGWFPSSILNGTVTCVYWCV